MDEQVGRQPQYETFADEFLNHAAIRILIGRAGLRLTADDLAELSGRSRGRSVATERLG